MMERKAAVNNAQKVAQLSFCKSVPLENRYKRSAILFCPFVLNRMGCITQQENKRCTMS